MNNLYIFSLNSALSSASGGDKFAVEICKRFQSKGEVLITTSKYRHEQHKNSDLKINTLVFTDKPPTIHPLLYYIINVFKAYFSTLKYLKKYRKENKDTKITYFSGCEYFPDIIPAFIFKLLGLIDVWVITSHLIMPNMFQRYEDIYQGKKHTPSLKMTFNWLNQWLATTLYKLARCEKYYFAVNKDIQNFLEKRNIKSSIVNCGVDTTNAAQEINSDKIYDAVFLARLHAQKGVPFIIPITKEVIKSKPDFKFLVIGGGDFDMESKLRKDVIENNLSENIIVAGQKIGKEKDDLLKQSKIFVFPSTYESFGIVILEASSFGLPTVAFRLPFYEDIYGDAIITVDFEDIEGYGKAIVELLQDPNQQKTMVEKTRKLLKKYTWENSFENIVETISNKS